MSNLDQELKKRYDKYYDQLGKDFTDYKNQNKEFLDKANWRKFSKQIIHTRDQILDNKFKEELIKKYKSCDSRFKGNYAENFIKFDVEEIRQSLKLQFKIEGIERYVSKISRVDILEIVAEFLAYEDFITTMNNKYIPVFRLDPDTRPDQQITKSIRSQSASKMKKVVGSTVLTQVQTCILINELIEAKLILCDPATVTQKEIANYFSRMANYESEGLRKGISEVKKDLKRTDINNVKNHLLKMVEALENKKK